MTPCVLIKCKSMSEWINSEPCLDGRFHFEKNAFVLGNLLFGNYFILRLFLLT